METIKIKLKKTEDRSYEIKIGNGILKDIPKDLKKENLAYSYALVTDSTVSSLYGKKMFASFKKEGLLTHLISFPTGEKYKTRRVKAWVEDEMMKLGMGRDSAIIALGGGVVGDLAGFVAATYNRGIPLVQVPTTLLATVDSSVGGKTGVDTGWGKNLIGAFYQPWRVYIDVEPLKTLPAKELRNGLAEVIKYGIIKDKRLFELLEKKLEDIFLINQDILIFIIKRSCEIKGKIVELDEREGDLRKILNFGHTVGHAIENLLGYKISHGEAISIGMVVEGRVAVELGLWEETELKRLILLFSRAGLPTNPPKKLNFQKMLASMKLDKKARGGRIEMVLPQKIGKMYRTEMEYGVKVEEKLILTTLNIISQSSIR